MHSIITGHFVQKFAAKAPRPRLHPHADFSIMHCMNADLSDQAITLAVAVAVKQASVAHAPIDPRKGQIPS